MDAFVKRKKSFNGNEFIVHEMEIEEEEEINIYADGNDTAIVIDKKTLNEICKWINDKK